MAWLRGLLARLANWWRVEEPPGERIQGSGEVYLDPAYNGRYTAERRLRELAEADEEPPSAPDRDP